MVTLNSATCLVIKTLQFHSLYPFYQLVSMHVLPSFSAASEECFGWWQKLKLHLLQLCLRVLCLNNFSRDVDQIWGSAGPLLDLYQILGRLDRRSWFLMKFKLGAHPSISFIMSHLKHIECVVCSDWQNIQDLENEKHNVPMFTLIIAHFRVQYCVFLEFL